MKFSRRDIVSFGAGFFVGLIGKAGFDRTQPNLTCSDAQIEAAIEEEQQLNYVLEGNLRRPTSAIAFFAKAAFRSQERIILRDPFHEILRQAIVKRAAFFNSQVITFPHGLTGNPAEGAAENLTKFLREPYGLNDLPLKGILLTPVDSYIYTNAMIQGQESGISIVTLDTPLDEINQRSTLCHVGSDNDKLGRKLADYAMDQIPPPAEVLLILGPYREINSDLRMQGMINTLAGMGYKVTTIANGDWSTFFGRGSIQWFNRLYPTNNLQMILCANDNMAKGVSLYYQGEQQWSGKSDRPFIGGIDGSKDAIDFIRRGVVDVTIAQNDRGMGEKAVDALINYVDKGIEPEPFIDAGGGAVIWKS